MDKIKYKKGKMVHVKTFIDDVRYHYYDGIGILVSSLNLSEVLPSSVKEDSFLHELYIPILKIKIWVSDRNITKEYNNKGREIMK